MKKIKFHNSNDQLIIEKIVCVGRNYADHAKELGNEIPTDFPIIFLKPASNVIFSGQSVIHPSYSNNLHHETELVLLIGKTLKDASNLQQAEDAIWGYAVGLDMTLRDLQNQARDKGDPWTISKCFDTAAVLSDFVQKKDHLLTGKEMISLKVNGKIRQNCALDKMIFSPAELVKYISSIMTLEKGDLIFTGTPAGVSKVVKGDKLEAEISGIGKIMTEIA
ncbi:MAG: fumarylacetoacetate hydrolase family protein [Bacteroidota bacterium]|nr:fumarylacetoacetate hydrolase family protein [Bacteroidota bacterium]MDP4193212.1 fumarylacetoacetate hydrolase family protein [Bacteroidota bacterium]MDP4195412.1 fumarylacetoacetate hydrolase family protein [Bacteroidota bacterium]